MFRPCHLLAFAETAQEVNWRMKSLGSGAGITIAYIWTSL
jgi:hypothetical protein